VVCAVGIAICLFGVIVVLCRGRQSALIQQGSRDWPCLGEDSPQPCQRGLGHSRHIESEVVPGACCPSMSGGGE
jgi:hypothetical protein